MHIETIVLTSKKIIFNGNSFANFEADIGFVSSKQVCEWSQILISSSGWPCTQNESKFKLSIHRLFRKTWIFANDFKYRHIIYHWKEFFITCMNLRLLPQNNAPFSSDPLAKFVIFCTKMHADDPGTFVRNKGYHFEEEAKMSVLGPWTSSGSCKRRCFAVILSRLPHMRSIIGNDIALATKELPPLPYFWHLLSSFLQRVWPLSSSLPSILSLSWGQRWERKRGF